jgi:hypothetical protein
MRVLHPMPPRRVIRAALAGLLVGASACVRYRRQDAVYLSTDPPGAAILVDGADSGYTTPAWLPLSGGERRVVLRRAGYLDENLVLRRGEDVELVGLRVWISSSSTFSPFPVTVSLRDAIAPIKIDAHPFPRRLHLQLLAETPPPKGP